MASKTRLFERCRFDRIAGALILATWLTTAIALQAQTFTTLLSFDRTNGAWPQAVLVQGRDGRFYGTTSRGGGSDSGEVFAVTQTGTLEKLRRFDEYYGLPDAGLVLGTEGSFYGMVTGGAAHGDGAIFKITPSGRLVTLYNFDDTAWGPNDALMLGSDGNL